jgi:hypothetical protein
VLRLSRKVQTAIRFRPPEIRLTDDLQWALKRAYGPMDHLVLGGNQVTRFELAKRLGVLSRIANRCDLNLLSAEIGHEQTALARSALAAQAMRGLALKALEDLVLGVAERARVKVLLLKAAAMKRLGFASPTTRQALDLDILVHPDQLDELCAALDKTSLHRRQMREAQHQPVVFESRWGVSVELHVHLPYVRLVSAGKPVTLQDIEELSLVRHTDGGDSWVLLPSMDLLVAHLIAHGIVQHGLTPRMYPSMRLVSDMVDLGLGNNPQLGLDAHRWIRHDVSQTEVGAIAEVAAFLTQGNSSDIWNKNSSGSRMLNHFVAAALDSKYRARLDLRRIIQSLSEDGAWRTINEGIAYAFTLPDENLRRIYPTRRHSMRLTRLLRPFDLAYRVVLTACKATFTSRDH